MPQSRAGGRRNDGDSEGDSVIDEDARARLHLPFYLYESPMVDDGTWFGPCARGLRGETYVEDQYSGEHYFLRQLRGHRWRVADPMHALLFVVPLYINAALQPSVQGTSCNGTHYQRLLDATAAAVASTTQYVRHHGADHLIVCNSWKLAQRPPHQAPWSKLGQLPNAFFRHTFRNAIVGHMETRHDDETGFWRCSVVSPYTANYDESAQLHLRAPTAPERDVSFYFQGGANNRGTFGYAFRQAALAQLDGFPRAHVSAFSLPGSPVPCRGSITTNCRAGRSNPAFRSLMARARFNLVLRGDSPSSRRVFDGIAVGALSVVVSDHLWTVGLPFGCLVPWRKMIFTLAERAFHSEGGAAAPLQALDGLSPAMLHRMQRLANRYRRDLIWNMNGSRVAENLLLTAALRCLPAHVARRASLRAAAIAQSLRQLSQRCPHADHTIACRVPDESNCAGCETGDLAAGSPLEYCCGDSCPACNRTPSRCVPTDVYYGAPTSHDPSRRDGLKDYLAQKEKDVPAELQRWRKLVGKPKNAPPPKAKGSALSSGRAPSNGRSQQQGVRVRVPSRGNRPGRSAGAAANPGGAGSTQAAPVTSRKPTWHRRAETD